MVSAKIDVTVLAQGRLVDGPLQRPVRLTPDGVAGAVYGGVVYPVRAGNLVDLDDTPFNKYDCARFLDAGVPIPYAIASGIGRDRPVMVDRWYVERNKFGTYLVLDGPESVAEAVVDRLEDAGVEIVRWDASHRPADDGHHYDWFIRFRPSGTVAETCAQIADVLGVSAERGVAASAGADGAADVELRLDSVRRENDSLRQQLAASEARERSLLARRRSEEETTARVTEAARRLREHLHALRTRNTELETTLARERTTHAAASKQESVHADLQREQTRLLQHLAYAEDEWVAAQERADELELERDKLLTENAALHRERTDAIERADQLRNLLDESTSEAEESARRDTAARGAGRTRRQTPDEFLAKLFPRLTVDGIDELLSFPKPLAVIKALIRLQEKDQLRGKLFQGPTKHRITEVDQPFHTGEAGNSSMGRLYYAQRNAGTLAVLVHRKHDAREQDRVVQGFDDRIDELPPARDARA